MTGDAVDVHDGTVAATPVAATPRTRTNRDADLVRIAAELFRKRGYAETSVQNIATELGIRKASVYHYIDSKDDLLYRICCEVHEDGKQVLDDIEAMDATALERLDAYIHRHVHYIIANIDRISVYYSLFERLSPDRRTELAAFRRQHVRRLSQLVEAARQEGAVRADADPRLAASCVLGTMNWVYTWYREGGRVQVDELADFIARFCLDGLVVR